MQMESYTKVGSKSTISNCFLKQRNFHFSSSAIVSTSNRQRLKNAKQSEGS
ncbi:hypothetical protein MtrunA17_Chr7g0266321 [Medicago truncatula]|uniref:Uncharacterized protein n=1 Tax=Medicago truncatula TaxID=3880 RepID=A0A396H7A6_MEDTR|nr:hypothetical protein MtrunA17_Chr7g0266321 [Medicago truncatula]